MTSKIKRILAFLLKWNELWTIPIGIMLWFAIAWWLRSADENAAIIPSDIWLQPLFAIVCLMIFTGTSWVLFKINFPGCYKTLDDVIEKSMEGVDLTTYQKIKLALWIFSLFLGSLVYLSRAI